MINHKISYKLFATNIMIHYIFYEVMVDIKRKMKCGVVKVFYVPKNLIIGMYLPIPGHY